MKIKKVVLESHNLTKIKNFYHHCLGLECLEEQTNYVSFRVGYSQLCFTKSERPVSTGKYHFAFNIPENQLLESEQWLKQKGIDCLEFEDKVQVDFPNWNAHALYFTDSDNNILEFIARHDLSNTATASFNANSLLSISEIGFGVPQVGDFYEWLKDNFDLPVYSHISNMTRFCATGDPNGLFIIVPLERNWFPSIYPNAVLPTKVYVEGQTNQELQYSDLPYHIISRLPNS